MRVEITKGSTQFPKGCPCKVHYIDVERIGVFPRKHRLNEDEEKYADEDDEEYLEELNEKEPLSPEQVVMTYFLVVSPKNNKFYWVNSCRTILLTE